MATGVNPAYGFFSTVLIDSVHSKLLVVNESDPQGFSPAVVTFVCDLDGTACTGAPLTNQGNPQPATTPSAAIDAANGKLLVAVRDGNSLKPALFRCNLDGSSCTYSDISVGQGVGSGTSPNLVIDTVNAKALVVTNNGASSSKPALFRCNLDGTSCTFSDLSAGQGPNSGLNPAAAVDAASGKLLVVTDNGANGHRPSLFRCNLDGTACTHTDIGTGLNDNGGHHPKVALDVAGHRLLAVTEDDANYSKAQLYDVCLR
jgi:hypothetical protein